MNININQVIALLSLPLLLLFSNCERNKELATVQTESSALKIEKAVKWNGVNLVAISTPIDSSHIVPIVNVNANSVAIVPFGFVRSGKSAVEYNLEWQWHGEKLTGAAEQIQLAHNAKLRVLLKPHLWTHDGWVGDLDYQKEEGWLNFESTYTTFILDFARIADSMKVEALCIGVELKKSVIKRPEFWKQLIDSIRTVYSGELTYASNWDNFHLVSFWNQLDYIGIEAYFPVSAEKTPSVVQLKKGWEKHKQQIKQVSDKENKPIWFTEYGYRNIDYTGKEPWTTAENSTFNTQGQNNGYEALYQTFWNEDWFHGGFLWKWYPNHEEIVGESSNRFTPQNKPAQKIISTYYEIEK